MEVLSEKVNLQNEVLNEAKNNLLKRMNNIEKNVIQKLDQGKTPDLSFNLRSFEDTVTKLEQEMSALSNDFVIFRDKTSREVQEGLEIIG